MKMKTKNILREVDFMQQTELFFKEYSQFDYFFNLKGIISIRDDIAPYKQGQRIAISTKLITL